MTEIGRAGERGSPRVRDRVSERKGTQLNLSAIRRGEGKAPGFWKSFILPARSAFQTLPNTGALLYGPRVSRDSRGKFRSTTSKLPVPAGPLLLVASPREGPKISKWPWKGGPVARFHSARHALTRGFPSRTIRQRVIQRR